MKAKSGDFSGNRKLYRNIVRVVDISKKSTRGIVDVIVSGWNPNISIELSLALVHEWISDFEPRVGSCLIAKVNSGAEESEDLYFTDFEKAIDPEEVDEF